MFELLCNDNNEMVDVKEIEACGNEKGRVKETW